MDCNLGTTHFNHENGSSIFLWKVCICIESFY
jgi:hypothetical protein